MGLGGSCIVHLLWSVVDPALSYYYGGVVDPALSYCYGCVVDPALSYCYGCVVDPALSTCCGGEVDPALSNPEDKLDLIPFTLSTIITTKLYSFFSCSNAMCIVFFSM